MMACFPNMKGIQLLPTLFLSLFRLVVTARTAMILVVCVASTIADGRLHLLDNTEPENHAVVTKEQPVGFPQQQGLVSVG